MKRARIILALLVFAGSFGYWVASRVALVRDIDAVTARAQLAADRDDMLAYLTQLEENLVRHGVTHGHWAALPWRRTMENDAALHLQSVQRMRGRLIAIEHVPPTDAAYQVALDDLRGTLRELPRIATPWHVTHAWVYLVLAAIGAIVVVLTLLGVRFPLAAGTRLVEALIVFTILSILAALIFI
ncbi:MAG: hypothetical protein HY520_00205 [Candidatus Aenigmarchaeota archaeon]|nr:hypothetical protein [Candidatus Aenigmarchaeota archaeon]